MLPLLCGGGGGGGLALHPPPPSQRAQAPGQAAPGTAGCSWPGVAPKSSPDPVGREEREGLCCWQATPGTHCCSKPHRHCWCSPARLVPLTSSARMARPSRRLKKLLMGAVWWYLQNSRGTQRGSAWLQHSSLLLVVGETEAQHPSSSSPSAESCDQ